MIEKMIGTGFYAITDSRIAENRGMTLFEQARKLLKGGAKALQYRDKTLNSVEGFFENAKKLKKMCLEYGVPFIINDRLDVAVELDVMVHLGQEDLDELKKIGDFGKNERFGYAGGYVNKKLSSVMEGLKFGISTHSFEQAIEAEKMGASYIGIGPFFGTPTKPTYKPIGIETVKQVVENVKIPKVAIGGLDLQNIRNLSSLGIENCAMVRAALQADDIGGFVGHVNKILMNN